MTTRILPPEEWARLVEAPLPEIRAAALDGHVLVVEDDGAIVGSWVLMRCLHLEGAWIAPAYRGRVSVGRRLVRGMRDLIASYGASGALACLTDPQTRQMVRHRATPVLGDHVVLRLAHE